MSRKKPLPQLEHVQLNLSTERRVKDELMERAERENTDASKIVTRILLREFGMS